jgi:hypothetical protein
VVAALWAALVLLLVVAAALWAWSRLMALVAGVAVGYLLAEWLGWLK